MSTQTDKPTDDIKPHPGDQLDIEDVLGTDAGLQPATPEAEKPAAGVAGKIASLAFALFLAVAGIASATSLTVPTAGTVSGLSLAQQINVLSANLSTMIESASAPTTASTGLSSTAGVWWHDTGNNIIKIRDQADANWISVFQVDESSKTIRAYATALTVNSQSGTSYTFAAGDLGKLVTFSNASAKAGTLPQATGVFGSGWTMDVQNTGAADLTITPTTSTIDGASSLVIKQNQGVRIASDGTNYFTERGLVSFVGGTLTSTTTMSGAALNMAAPASLGGAATTDIGSVASNTVIVGGASTTITSLGATIPGAWRTVYFNVAGTTLTNNAAIVLPGGANIVTAQGDVGIFFGSTTAGQWICINYTKISQPAGGSRIAQVVNTETGAVATGTTAIPFDDTIPQNTEGDQYMSLSITPTNPNSTLIIDVRIFMASSATSNSAALFQDSTANALAAAYTTVPNSGATGLSFVHKMTAGTTSSTTFKLRAGSSNGSTLTVNGQGSARVFGGAMASSITITEVLP